VVGHTVRRFFGDKGGLLIKGRHTLTCATVRREDITKRPEKRLVKKPPNKERNCSASRDGGTPSKRDLVFWRIKEEWCRCWVFTNRGENLKNEGKTSSPSWGR